MRRCSKLESLSLLVVCFLALSLSIGCTTARMAVKQDLAGSAEEMAVEGKRIIGLNNFFQFGPYSVSDIHRGWKTTTKLGALGFGSSSSKQKSEFSLSKGSQRWLAQCATGVKWKELEMGDFLSSGGTLTSELESDTIYICQFDGPGDWKLAMNQGTGDMVMNGVLTDGMTTINVDGTRALAGSSWPLMEPTGYHFVASGRTVGAVEIINQGAVWISESLPDPQQNAIANAAAALLLYKGLK